VALWVGDETPNIEKRVDLNYQINGSVNKGTRVGIISILADGQHVQSVPLLVAENINSEENSLENWLKSFLNRLKES
jgi:D-alanyl-D-alanine carboxypeptidase (penicillin-binding protein 5/6)